MVTIIRALKEDLLAAHRTWSCPYKDDVYNVFHKFKPSWKYNGTDYYTYLAKLYGKMKVAD